MGNEYIEIVHADEHTRVLFSQISERHKQVADNIATLEASVGVIHIQTTLEDDPCLPKDTLIRIGGAAFESCVRRCIINLINMGYENCYADKNISFAGHYDSICPFSFANVPIC